ncbi:unnamed protein product [Effrenium voratum]|uniref:Uncharacterized protein n=1 Tax=Effrenium voratum TaxID=2562239 RepID=A0AA36IVU5_9DINO|nr:unnamed protein product [Effrenium voratum]
MCPLEYKVQDGIAEVDAVVDCLLQHQVAKIEQTISQKAALFEPRRAASTQKMDFVLKPKVPGATWTLWQEVFAILDPRNTGWITNPALQSTRLICPEVCNYMCELLCGAASVAVRQQEAPSDGFSKEDFLRKMLEVTNLRHPDS